MVTTPLGAEADAVYSVLGDAAPSKLSIGVKRRCEFLSTSLMRGVVDSELIGYEDNVRLTWQQLASECDYVNLVGEEGGAAPTYETSFADAPEGGTYVTIAYQFTRIAFGGTANMLSKCLPCLYNEAEVQKELIRRLATNCPPSWADAMEQRGYSASAGGGAPKPAVNSVTVNSVSGATPTPATPGSAAASGAAPSSDFEPPAFGLRTYTFAEAGPLGLQLAIKSIATVKQLVIETVQQGAQAQRLGVVVGGQVTAVNGAAMGAQALWKELETMAKERPLLLSVYVPPPSAAKAAKESKSRKFSFGRKKSKTPSQ